MIMYNSLIMFLQEHFLLNLRVNALIGFMRCSLPISVMTRVLNTQGNSSPAVWKTCLPVCRTFETILNQIIDTHTFFRTSELPCTNPSQAMDLRLCISFPTTIIIISFNQSVGQQMILSFCSQWFMFRNTLT